MTGFIGRSIPRVEYLRFVTGSGRFSDDLTMPAIVAVI